MPSRRLLLGAVPARLLATALPAFAQSDDSGPEIVPVRGTVEAVGAGKLTLKSPRGQNLAVQLDPDWEALTVSPSSLSAIKPGSFIATTTAGRGNHVAVRVVAILSPTMRDVGQGHYRWDFGPKSIMANPIVDALVTQARGRQLTVSWAGAEKDLVVPSGLPVVELARSARAMVTPGAKAFLFARIAGGRASARYVLVGANGYTPPM
jgi:hypothetical protein